MNNDRLVSEKTARTVGVLALAMIVLSCAALFLGGPQWLSLIGVAGYFLIFITIGMGCPVPRQENGGTRRRS